MGDCRSSGKGSKKKGSSGNGTRRASGGGAVTARAIDRTPFEDRGFGTLEIDIQGVGGGQILEASESRANDFGFFGGSCTKSRHGIRSISRTIRGMQQALMRQNAW